MPSTKATIEISIPLAGDLLETAIPPLAFANNINANTTSPSFFSFQGHKVSLIYQLAMNFHGFFHRLSIGKDNWRQLDYPYEVMLWLNSFYITDDWRQVLVSNKNYRGIV